MTEPIDTTDHDDATLATMLGTDDWGPALAELWDRHAAVVYGVARSITGNDHDAQDATSDTLAKLAERAAAGTLTVDRSFRSYAITAVRNTVHNQWRVARRVQTSDRPLPPDEVDPGPDHPDRYEDALDQEYVTRAFAALPETHREILWLVEVEGLPPREVAALVDLSPNNVSQIASRARKALREGWVAAHLEDLGPVEVCAEIARDLPAYLAATLSSARLLAVDDHLASCESCRTLVSDLEEDTAKLRALLPLPAALLFEPLATRLGIWAQTGGQVAAGSAAAGVATGKVIAAAVATAVVAVTGVGIWLAGSDDTVEATTPVATVADPPPETTTTTLAEPDPIPEPTVTYSRFWNRDAAVELDLEVTDSEPLPADSPVRLEDCDGETCMLAGLPFLDDPITIPLVDMPAPTVLATVDHPWRVFRGCEVSRISRTSDGVHEHVSLRPYTGGCSGEDLDTFEWETELVQCIHPDGPERIASRSQPGYELVDTGLHPIPTQIQAMLTTQIVDGERHPNQLTLVVVPHCRSVSTDDPGPDGDWMWGSAITSDADLRIVILGSVTPFLTVEVTP